MGGMILQRLDDVQILTSVQKAVRRSCGELIDIGIKGFGTDHLLDRISRCSSKLNCLRLEACDDITPCGLSNALKRLPHLETLKLYDFHIPKEEDIELIGRSYPLLKSFEMETLCASYDVYARAIAKSMPALRHLKLFGLMDDDNGVQAILNGCPYLESLDLRGCPYHDLDLDENLEKLCRERIKDFRCCLQGGMTIDIVGLIADRDEDSDMDFTGYETNDFYNGRGMDVVPVK
ncbi:hypothetical protein OSB04_001859 [Centaurea solstitialis]|uniref:Uncharacterized protein n=1 Tax=Centaurea solstitialis TaxID=347529 RepID=A0AA38TZC5_9ASTR|nr:hypothetical protein OSB04_001859 [Centaurea solstitialis]